jgi:Uma2 family endonuclease
MTALMPERPLVDLPDAVVLSPQEYDALPPNNRIELVDGVVQVMTPATRRHQIVVQKMRLALENVSSDNFRIVWEQEVRLADSTRRNPDVMIVRASADDLDAYSYEPGDVLLAVEVVSPGTQTIDRLHKPAEYAAAKIEHYWYVEISPQIVVHTYRLGETGRYLESGLFKEGDQVAAPGLMWARVPVSDLMP